MAQMMAILGPPPLDFLQRSEKCKRFWDQDGRLSSNSDFSDSIIHNVFVAYTLSGQWTNETPIPDISLESAEHRLQGEEKALFLAFMRKMLQWKPEDRCSCQDVFWDERLLADLIEKGVIEPPTK